MSKENTKIFTINFNIPFFEEIEAEAKKEGRPIGQFLKLIARRHLDKIKNDKNTLQG